MMEKMLTEIGSYSLFHEYLNVVGVASPALARIKTRWEYKKSDRLVAQIRVDQQGNARFYIDARAISVN
ncbi:hypothetical protein WH06_13845 [Aeromonas salmonicida subsp. salmonicida]|jgi:hypothetical protein|uniref:Uncharacterized protein n=7 Tax=Bacteria TaxID=2 RepID=A0A3L0W0S6_ECOLX|nr:conserved hypothetical protein [Aeromonas salmonicida subsp. salmonicida A449]ARW84812.1 hypothetical protein O23A_p4075 [Aeromonas salmonicida]ATD36886.1 hypothetical protein BHG40_02085 [Aeromonas salmonicida subsp. masoucida]ATP07587.1 uncharacterized protein Asalp_03330 [Aeromonas salmonicida subsp. pectinolytica 34mel]AYO64851.1 hypothetical protein C5P03_20065 [Aeromonas salmonicida subsp. salmonicida 01-B526]KHE98853.1 hypothetical protein NV17_06815 [Aeromonas salmonicida subsp. sal